MSTAVSPLKRREIIDALRLGAVPRRGLEQFFAHHNLPRISSERAIAEATDLSLMDLDEASF